MTFETKKLSSIPYGQTYTRTYENGCVELISYTTVVAVIDHDGWLIIGGLYSMTTRKHIGAFMREYCNSNYQLAKQIYNDDMMYNIYTGEVKER